MNEINSSEPIFYGLGKPDAPIPPIPPTLTDDQLRALSPENFLDYLSRVEIQPRPDIILAPHIEILAKFFSETPKIYTQNQPLAESLAEKIETAILRVTGSKTHPNVKPEILEQLYTTT